MCGEMTRGLVVFSLHRKIETSNKMFTRGNTKQSRCIRAFNSFCPQFIGDVDLRIVNSRPDKYLLTSLRDNGGKLPVNIRINSEKT